MELLTRFLFFSLPSLSFFFKSPRSNELGTDCPPVIHYSSSFGEKLGVGRDGVREEAREGRESGRENCVANG